MSGTHARPALAGYRDMVTELITKGATLGAVEVAINAQAGMTEDQKAALWLCAFSLHDRAEQPDRARPREFDANGFPVPQRNRSFQERVSRLRNPQ